MACMQAFGASAARKGLEDKPSEARPVFALFLALWRVVVF